MRHEESREWFTCDGCNAPLPDIPEGHEKILLTTPYNPWFPELHRGVLVWVTHPDDDETYDLCEACVLKALGYALAKITGMDPP